MPYHIKMWKEITEGFWILSECTVFTTMFLIIPEVTKLNENQTKKETYLQGGCWQMSFNICKTASVKIHNGIIIRLKT